MTFNGYQTWRVHDYDGNWGIELNDQDSQGIEREKHLAGLRNDGYDWRHSMGGNSRQPPYFDVEPLEPPCRKASYEKGRGSKAADACLFQKRMLGTDKMFGDPASEIS
jgi:hypothetical protein